MNRVRGIMREYALAGPSGELAIMVMERSIKSAEKAIATGDTIAMMAAYKDLEEYEL